MFVDLVDIRNFVQLCSFISAQYSFSFHFWVMFFVTSRLFKSPKPYKQRVPIGHPRLASYINILTSIGHIEALAATRTLGFVVSRRTHSNICLNIAFKLYEGNGRNKRAECWETPKYLSRFRWDFYEQCVLSRYNDIYIKITYLYKGYRVNIILLFQLE